MRIILNPHDTDDALDHMQDLIVRLRQEHAELRSRFLTDRDGYPTQSMGNGGSPTNELDDDGTPIPQHPDPVGRLVVSRDEANDPVGNALASLVNHIATARRELEAGVSDAASLRPPIKITDPDELWCENCRRAGANEPREEGRKLCRWCREEKTDHGRLPSPRLVAAHLRGKISPTQRREIALRDATDRKANKHKAKRSA